MANDIEIIQKLLASGEPIKWLFTGDSITHGALHTFGWRDYTEIFSERLRYEMGRGRDFILKTGISGWQITNILPDLEWNVLQFKAHVVSLAVGMNDCTNGQGHLKKFEELYRETVKRVRNETGAAIILNTPQHIMPTDAVRAPHLPAYADVIRNIAASMDAVLVDHHATWHTMEYGAMTYLLSDAIHPNEMGHRLMAKMLLEKLGLWDGSNFVGRMFIA